MLDIDASAHRRQTLPLILEAGDNDLGTLILTAELGEDNAAVTMRGLARLSGRSDHSGITVRGLLGNVLADIGTTDVDGNFILQTARGDHTLQITRHGFVSQSVEVTWSSLRERFEVLDEALESFEGISLQPDRSATLRGQLSTSVSPFDLSAASVTLVGEIDLPLPAQSTGHFALEALVPGLYGLSVEVEGHLPVHRLITLDVGDNDLGIIALTPVAASLVGRVVLDGETDHGDVTVRLRHEGALVDATLSDSDGRFVFQALPRGHTLSLSRDDFIPRDVSIEFEGDGFTLDGQALLDNPITLLRQPHSDRDRDGTLDLVDNCPNDFNPDQIDLDGDSAGDRCDGDMDEDGLVNGLDNCPLTFNPMQEDPEGDGLGVACVGGEWDDPFELSCGIHGQRLDTRNRPDDISGSCGGGGGAPELVYRFGLHHDTRLKILVEADHPVAIYALNESGAEVACLVGTELVLYGSNHPDAPEGEGLPEGRYRLVVDGFSGEDAAGPIRVDVLNTACETTLAAQPPLTTGESPYAPIIVDLDGDGLNDIVTPNAGDNTLTVLQGIGEGAFEVAATLPTGTLPVGVRAADLDADGIPDLVSANAEGDNVNVFLGDGDLRFAQPLTFAVGDEPNAVAVGDLDEDGVLDIVVSEANANSVGVLLGRGDGTFEARQAHPVGSIPIPIALSDLDLDGHLDAVTATFDTDAVEILYGRGDGSFDEPQRLSTCDGPIALNLADLTQDGLIDVAVVCHQSGHLALHTNDGRRSMQAPRLVFLGTRLFGVQSGDINSDGIIDLVAVQNTQDRVFILTGEGRGRFVTPLTLAVGDGPLDAALGDINGDQLTDMVVSSLRENNLGVFFAQPGRRFAVQERFLIGDLPQNLALADIDRDGALDAITPNLSNDSVTVAYNDGEGRFSDRQTLPISNDPNDVVVADLDHDGHLDIVTVLAQTRTLGVMRGLGARRFSTPAFLDLPGSPSRFRAGDLDSDGHLDLVVRLSSNLITILRGLGNATFVIHQTLSTRHQDVQLADLDHDGDLDLVVVEIFAGLGALKVLIGRGDATFSETLRIPLSVPAFDVAVGDLDQDGDVDAILPRQFDTGVVWMRGDGQGGFGPELPLLPDVSPSGRVDLFDLNRDGLLDLFVRLFGTDNFHVHLGLGEGQLAPPLRMRMGNTIRGVSIGDVNRDGQLDILSVDPNTNDLRVLLHFTRLETATRLVRAPLPSCSARTLTSAAQQPGQVPWRLSALQPCKVDRMELDLTFDVRLPPRALTFETPLGFDLPLSTRSRAWPRGTRWNPEQIDGLARLQEHPLSSGQWALDVPFEVESAQMLINRFPADPFGPDTLAALCGQVDQPEDPEAACRLPEAPQPLAIEALDDTDLFLLTGPLSGAFVAGQSIEVEVDTEPGDGLIEVALLPLRAEVPIMSIQIAQGQPGLLRLDALPATFDGRYLAVRVRALQGASLPARGLLSHPD